MIFTALSGDAASTKSKPFAYVLQIDDVKVLLDCGSPDWCPESNEDADWEPYCKALESVAPSIDLVLFSHGDLSHVGLYAYAHAHWGLHAPAYSSLPVQALGKIAVTEEVENIRAEQDVDASTSTEDSPKGPRPRIPTTKEVATAFDALITLRYSQPSHLSGKCQGLTITPYAAGHTLGGTIWKIRSPSSGTIMYAVELNHMKERHLDGTVLVKSGGGGGSAVFEPLARPDLFITDADRALVTVPRRKDRDAALLETITNTLEDAHSVLIPCDSSARLLELLILLDQHWSFARLRAPICLMSRTGKEMLSIVRSLVEWMGGTIGKEDISVPLARTGKRKRDDEDDDMGNLALRFRHLEFFPSPAALVEKYPSSKPKLILAVPASMSHGPSRSAFLNFASVSRNVVILTSRGEPGTLSRMLYDRWLATQRADSSNTVGEPAPGKGDSFKLTVKSKVPLQGAELEAHHAQERAAKEKEAAAQAALVRTQRMLEADEGEESESDSEDEGEGGDMSDEEFDDEGDGNNIGREGENGPANSGNGLDWSLLDTDENQTRAQQLSFDIYLKGNVSRNTSFFKPTVAGGASSNLQSSGLTRYRMFPMVERKRRVDAYGETLDVGAWMRKGRALEEDKRAGFDDAERPDEPDAVAEVEVPSKFITEEITITLSCHSFYVDLEGLNDGRAVKTIVPQVKPRKMIIVHASAEATQALVSSCASIRAMTKEIFCPVVEENLVVGQQTTTFTISLSDELLDTVAMSRFEDSQVGYVRGRIAISADSSIPLLEPATVAPEPSVAPNDAASPSSTYASKPAGLALRKMSTLPNSSMIGDLKLTVLKTRLGSLGIGAEFAGEGVLVCGGSGSSDDGYVAVKKTKHGQVVLEGAPSETYYKIRQEVYGLHAIIAS